LDKDVLFHYLRDTPNFLHLTPFIPLSFQERGEVFYRRGALAPLKHPIKLSSLSKGKIKRGGLRPPLKTTSPFPSGEGGQGDGVNAAEKRNMIICVTNLSELTQRD
jgi:hypothetical protein